MPRLSKDERRKQLLDVPAQLFSASSFSGVTTAALAKAAGVTEPVLYQHFDSKDKLYYEVLRDGCRRTLEEWRQIAATADTALGGVIQIARAQFRMMSELWVYYKLHVRAIAEASDSRVAQILCENYEQYHAFLMAQLQRAQDAKEMRAEVNVSDVAWFMLSQGLMFNVCRQIGLRKLEETGYLDSLIRSTMSGLSVGVAPKVG